MGMSSSQARLLNLTARMHQIEYKAAKLEAQKLQMANESKRVYDDYLNAIDSVKIQQKTLQEDGSVTYVDATYTSILNSGYFVQFGDKATLYGKDGAFRDGLIEVTQQDLDNFGIAPNKDVFVALQMNRIDSVTTTSTTTNSSGFKEVYTASQLAAALTGSNRVILMADIDLSGVSWTSKTFSGTLDGNGHTISGLQKGLFSNLTGQVSNLSLSGSFTSSGTNNAGILANGSNGAQISNVRVSGSINMTTYHSAGGLIGEAQNTTISNVTSTVNITGAAMRAGGIVGGATGSPVTVNNSSYSGDIYSSCNRDNRCLCGGIIGETWVTTNVSNCTSSGSVTAAGNATGIICTAGGIVGKIDSGTTVNVSNCESSSTLTANQPLSQNYTGTYYALLDSRNGSVANVTEGSPSGSVGANTQINSVLDNNTTPTYREMYDYIAAGKYFTNDEENPAEGYEDSTTWLTNMLNEAEMYLYQRNEEGEFYQVSVATDTGLQEVSDEVLLKKAEAKYEADMKRIDMKDRKYDSDLAAMDAERNAIKQEMETLKTVANDNVERTFKLFG